MVPAIVGGVCLGVSIVFEVLDAKTRAVATLVFDATHERFDA